MKKLALALSLFAAFSFSTTAQDADKIIDSYFDVMGSKEAFNKLTGMTLTANVNQGGMEIPIKMIRLKNGKQLLTATLQDKELVQFAYNGEVLWSTNFQTMKPEKSDSEALMLMEEQANDFPNELFDYKGKGYKAENSGEETVEGVECFKIKLTKTPLTIEGNEVENISYFYFDKESFVLIAQESEMLIGAQKGVIQFITYSDYQEVEGMYFAFSISQGIKGGPSQPLEFSEIIINPEVDESIFDFPTTTEE